MPSSFRSAPLAWLAPLLFAAPIFFIGCAHAAMSRDSRVVVLDFEANLEQSNDRDLGRGLADLLSGKLADSPGISVKERQTLSRYLGTATREPGEWQKVGQKIGVDYLVIGDVAQLGRNYVINTRLFDVRSGNIIKGSSLFRACERKEDLYPTLTAMTHGIAYDLDYLTDLRHPQAGGLPPREASNEPTTTPATAPAVQISH